jgi:outer membrane receptor protein involved in Fe transport
MRSRFSTSLALATALWLAVSAVLAVSGEIRGIVVDRSGTPLPGVTVVVRNDALGVPERGGVTDARGTFRIIGLPAGPGYRLRASMPTYAATEFADLAVPDGGALTQDVVLRPASELKETVKVEGKADVVDTDTVTTSTSFSSEFISGLPVLGRDYQDILSLAPGVTDVNNTGNPNIHGARDTDVLTLVDGVNTTDPFSGYYGQQLNIESIQEIEVITSGSRAEFSRAQGGFVNILTKSGGNDFKGSAKFYIRTSRLDGDGAGTDDPELVGGLGEQGFSDLRFTDLYPYLSLSGPIVHDKLWYIISGEYIQEETPVDLLTQALVVSTHGYRAFGKGTWQINTANKLAFSLNVDRTLDENQGLSSVVDVESGYSFKRGGPTYTVRESAVFSPTMFLDSAASWFDNNFQRRATTNPDTNHNGVLYVDDVPALGGNGDGFFQARERDPGEDYDRDRRYDVFEDDDLNGILGGAEDRDLDGRLTPPVGCEGAGHEDVNCNGSLDFEDDLNHSGAAEPFEDTGIPCSLTLQCPDGFIPGTRGNGRLDSEDANRNGLLDVVGTSGQTPFPFWTDTNGDGFPEPSEYRAPVSADRDYTRDLSGRYSGPNPYEYDDNRTRLTFKEDFSLFVGEFGGSHDLKVGGSFEKEGYDGTVWQRSSLRIPRPRTASRLLGDSSANTPRALTAILGIPISLEAESTGKNFGVYVQDTWKPIANLTVGLGLRLDVEDLTSFGYTYFDPSAERAAYNGLIEATGVDLTPNDVNTGGQGLCRDPLYGCSGAGIPPALGVLYSAIRTQAPKRLTRHNSEVDILGPHLSSVLGTDSDINDLRALGFNVRQREPLEIQNNNVAPRLSLTWDPWADGKSKGFASWGRFYDKLFLNTVTLEQGPDTVTRFYRFDEDGIDNLGLPDNQFGRSLSQSAPSGFQVDRSISTPYTDEATLGFQREIAPEVSLGITLIRRDFHNQLQDIDVNHYTVRNPITGLYTDDLGDEVLAGALKGSPPAQLPDGIPDLYIQNFFFNRVFRLGNYNEQTYRAVELELVKRLSRKWQMEASYTFSRAQGDAETFLSENGDDPTLSEYEYGYLDYDQTHVIKVNATTYLPGDWRIGGTATWASGLPYSFIQEVESNDDVGYFQARRVYGYNNTGGHFVPEGRNTHRNPSLYNFNARVEKNFVMGKASASAFLEVFNLLNSDGLRIYAYDSGVTRFNTFGTREFGRRFQLGIQVSF